MTKNISELIKQVLSKATEKIPQAYIHVQVCGKKDYIYRERVYCYELYHQMRLLWDDNGIVINCELDKRYHPFFVKQDMPNAIPDFLIHSQGNHLYNEAIIEVKCKFNSHNIKRDMSKLLTFKNELQYKKAIFLVFGEAATENSLKKIESICDEYNYKNEIEIWAHKACGNSAEIHNWL